MKATIRIVNAHFYSYIAVSYTHLGVMRFFFLLPYHPIPSKSYMPHFLQLVSTTLLLTLALFSCSATGKRHTQTPVPLEASFEVVDTTHTRTVTAQPYPMVELSLIHI